MKRLYRNILLLPALLLSFTSCENWLDLQPEGEATHDELYSTGSGYRSVLNGLYRNMGKKSLYGGELQFALVDCMSQQYDLTQSVTQSQSCIKASEFDYKDNNVVATTDALWAAAYNIIATANDLLQEIEHASPDIFEYGEMERNLIMGEAYACRALLHFDLLRLFAPAPVQDDGQVYVPYVSNYPNISAARIPVKDFLEKVIYDLKEAQRLTKEFDTSADGIKANASVDNRFSRSVENTQLQQFFAGRGYRLNYYAITALLARVCQYAGGTEREKEAFDYAKEIVEMKNGSTLFYNDNFTGFILSDGGADETQESKFNRKSDLKAKSSLIFAVYNDKSYEENGLEYYFARADKGGAPSNSSWLPVRVEYIFGNDVTEDIRANQWLYNTGVYLISGKWYLNPTESLRDETVNTLPVIRLTEMKYIMAEYYARTNFYDKAYEILNGIRRERGLTSDLPLRNTWNDFVKDLTNDAAREWIAEGQLFYLYKRLDAEVSVKTKKNGEQVRKLTKGELTIPAPENQKN